MVINTKDKLITLESFGAIYQKEKEFRQDADQALSTRIDNIIAPDGDPSLTEVSDARVSGQTTYNTLKARLDADKASVSTEMAEIKADLGDLDGSLKHNAYRNSDDMFFVYGSHEDVSRAGLVATWNKNKCTITGTATGTFRVPIIESPNSVPDWVIKGHTYSIKYTSENIYLRVARVDSGVETLLIPVASQKGNYELTIPEDITGIRAWLHVINGTDISNGETVSPEMYIAPTAYEMDVRISANTANLLETKSNTSDIKGIIDADNSTDLMRYVTPKSETQSGVTFTWGGNTCVISGTPSANFSRTIYSHTEALPEWLEMDREYFVKFNAENVSLRIYGYIDNVQQTTPLFNSKSDGSFTIPSGINGIVIVFRCSIGQAINETVTVEILTAHRNIELQEAIADISTDITEQFGYYSEVSELGIEADNFNKAAPVCVHHDNFYRTITGDAWKIGDNGNEAFPMTYTSPRTDYDVVDDGFRITSNVLTNDKTVAVASSIRLITNSASNNTFMVEVGVPDAVDGKTAIIVIGYNNLNDYKRVIVKYESTYSRYGIFIDGVNYTLTRIASIEGYADMVRILYVGGRLYLYADDTLLNIGGYALNLKTTSKVGIGVDKTYTIQTKFVNLFYFRDYITINPNYAFDAGHSENLYVFHDYVEESPQYAWVLTDINTRFSQYAERFELHKTDPYTHGSPRSESWSAGPCRNNLRKTHLSFDVYVGSDYVTDPTYDVHFQIHDLMEETDNIQRNPNIIIGILSQQWFVSVRGWHKKNEEKPQSGLAPDEQDQTEVVFADVTTGKWVHFDVYYKEGYMLAHHPVTMIYMDGQLVYKTHALNSYNRPRGGYAKYGIYKAPWKYDSSTTTERVILFDNFQYEY